MQYVLVDLQYDEASSYSILTPIFLNFILWIPPALDVLGRCLFAPSTLSSLLASLGFLYLGLWAISI